jgi:glycine cleavage system pyridoxal-binding protein P
LSTFPRTFSTSSVSASKLLGPQDTFAHRHLGSSTDEDVNKMLAVCGYKNLDALINDTVPKNIRNA